MPCGMPSGTEEIRQCLVAIGAGVHFLESNDVRACFIDLSCNCSPPGRPVGEQRRQDIERCYTHPLHGGSTGHLDMIAGGQPSAGYEQADGCTNVH